MSPKVSRRLQVDLLLVLSVIALGVLSYVQLHRRTNLSRNEKSLRLIWIWPGCCGLLQERAVGAMGPGGASAASATQLLIFGLQLPTSQQIANPNKLNLVATKQKRNRFWCNLDTSPGLLYHRADADAVQVKCPCPPQDTVLRMELVKCLNPAHKCDWAFFHEGAMNRPPMPCFNRRPKTDGAFGMLPTVFF
jgi:hypothetical protein